jgi:hypothetical protein
MTGKTTALPGQGIARLFPKSFPGNEHDGDGVVNRAHRIDTARRSIQRNKLNDSRRAVLFHERMSICFRWTCLARLVLPPTMLRRSGGFPLPVSRRFPLSFIIQHTRN